MEQLGWTREEIVARVEQAINEKSQELAAKRPAASRVEIRAELAWAAVLALSNVLAENNQRLLQQLVKAGVLEGDGKGKGVAKRRLERARPTTRGEQPPGSL